MYALTDVTQGYQAQSWWKIAQTNPSSDRKNVSISCRGPRLCCSTSGSVDSLERRSLRCFKDRHRRSGKLHKWRWLTKKNDDLLHQNWREKINIHEKFKIHPVELLSMKNWSQDLYDDISGPFTAAKHCIELIYPAVGRSIVNHTGQGQIHHPSGEP